MGLILNFYVVQGKSKVTMDNNDYFQLSDTFNQTVVWASFSLWPKKLHTN